MRIRTFVKTFVGYILIIAIAIFLDSCRNGWLPDIQIPESVVTVICLVLVAIGIFAVVNECIHDQPSFARRKRKPRY